ncbi:MAG: hypothetical protein IJY39_05945 [Clostridia bacterium]|nr:hypothetical protein [Clostridia bacterium]
MEKEKKELTPAEKHKRTKIIIIASFVGALALLLICTSIPGLLDNGGVERETVPPVDPEKLWETKEEGFDIMEYEEYLKYDRAIYLYDPRTGVTVGVDDETSGQNGEGFKLIYELLNAIIAGDSDTYNSLVHESVGHFDSFTQQQLYDITVTKESESKKEGAGGTYTEYVLKVEYKIHENNGSFRDTVEPDASRPQYFVINDSTGELLVMDIIDVVFKN